MSARRASLLVTCLVDQFRPEVGFAVVKVLRRLGVAVDVPSAQTCCGQPAFNAGRIEEARAVAARFLDVFEGSDAVVVPSGSCAAMVRLRYADLFKDDAENRSRAGRLAGRVWEFSEFLVKVLEVEGLGATFHGTLAYHESCHLRRELGISEEPGKLLGAIKEARLVPLARAAECCGFGGVFSAGFPRLSAEMGRDKVRSLIDSGADVAVACDTGCILQMRSCMGEGARPRILHLAEILAEGLPRP